MWYIQNVVVEMIMIICVMKCVREMGAVVSKERIKFFVKLFVAKGAEGVS